MSRVTVIRTLLQAGLSTHTIAQLLPCVKLAGGQAVPCSDLLDDQIASLTVSQHILDGVIAAAK